MKTYTLTVCTALLFALGTSSLSAQQFVANVTEKDSNRIKKEKPENSTIVLPNAREFVWLDKEAIPLNLATIIEGVSYPDDLLTAGFEPIVQISVLVDERGNPIRYVWLTETNDSVKEVIDPAIPSLKFSPAERNGKAVHSWISLAFKFKIR